MVSLPFLSFLLGIYFSHYQFFMQYCTTKREHRISGIPNGENRKSLMVGIRDKGMMDQLHLSNADYILMYGGGVTLRRVFVSCI